MDATISKEAKSALIEALKESVGKVGLCDDFESGNQFGISTCISIVESFPTSDGWIPVTERLPEKPYTVITYRPIAGISQGFYLDGYWTIEPQRHLFKPTHWMPLPNPPTE